MAQDQFFREAASFRALLPLREPVTPQAFRGRSEASFDLLRVDPGASSHGPFSSTGLATAFSGHRVKRARKHPIAKAAHDALITSGCPDGSHHRARASVERTEVSFPPAGCRGHAQRRTL